MSHIKTTYSVKNTRIKKTPQAFLVKDKGGKLLLNREKSILPISNHAKKSMDFHSYSSVMLIATLMPFSNCTAAFAATSAVASGVDVVRPEIKVAVPKDYALPKNPTVLHGNVTHALEAAGKMLVTSREAIGRVQYDLNDRAVFVGKDAGMKIDQARSATFIMETMDKRQAQVLGQIQSQGSVVMAFPGGVAFKDGSVVDVANLTVVAGRVKEISNGKIHMMPNSAEMGALIVNEGMIKVQDGGLAAFVAPNAANFGFILAKDGGVYMGNGVDLYGDGLIKFNVSETNAKKSVEKAKVRAKDLGLEKGMLVLDTGEALDVIKGVVNTGLTQTKTAVIEAGTIIIGSDSTTHLGKDTVAKTNGGTIIVKGQTIGAHGALDASSKSGKGGDVFVGGTWHGGRVDAAYGSKIGINQTDLERVFKTTQTKMQNAKSVTFGKSARIDVSGYGDAGTAVIWSDEDTSLQGFVNLDSKTGRAGFFEGSGAKMLVKADSFDYSNTAITPGVVLFDPHHVVLVQNAASGVTLVNTPWSSKTETTSMQLAGFDASGDGFSSISIGKIKAGETYTASGFMVVKHSISLNGALTLQADLGIEVRSQIQTAGDLRLISSAGRIDLKADLWSINNANIILDGFAGIGASVDNVKIFSDRGILLNTNGDIGFKENPLALKHSAGGFVVSGALTKAVYITSPAHLVLGHDVGVDGVKGFSFTKADIKTTGETLSIPHQLTIQGDGLSLTGEGDYEDSFLTSQGDININASISQAKPDANHKLIINTFEKVSGLGIISADMLKIRNAKSVNAAIAVHSPILSNILGDVFVSFKGGTTEQSLIIKEVAGRVNASSLNRMRIFAHTSDLLIGSLSAPEIKIDFVDRKLTFDGLSSMQSNKLEVHHSQLDPENARLIINPRDGRSGPLTLKTEDILKAWKNDDGTNTFASPNALKTLVLSGGVGITVEDNIRMGQSLSIKAVRDLILNDTVQTTDGADLYLESRGEGITRTKSNVKIISSGDLKLYAASTLGESGTFADGTLKALDISHGFGKRVSLTGSMVSNLQSAVHLVATTSIELGQVSTKLHKDTAGSFNITVLEAGNTLTISEKIGWGTYLNGDANLTAEGGMIWNSHVVTRKDINLKTPYLKMGLDSRYEAQNLKISNPLAQDMIFGSGANEFDFNTLINRGPDFTKIHVDTGSFNLITRQAVKKNDKSQYGAPNPYQNLDLTITTTGNVVFGDSFKATDLKIAAKDVYGVDPKAVVSSTVLKINADHIGDGVNDFYMQGTANVTTLNPIYISSPGDVSVISSSDLKVMKMISSGGDISINADGLLSLEPTAVINTPSHLTLRGNRIFIPVGAAFEALSLTLGTSSVDLNVFDVTAPVNDGDISIAGVLTGWLNNAGKSLELISGKDLFVKEALVDVTRSITFNAQKIVSFEKDVMAKGVIVRAENITCTGVLNGSGMLIDIILNGSTASSVYLAGDSLIKASSVQDLKLISSESLLIDAGNVISSLGNVFVDAVGSISGVGSIGAGKGIRLNGSLIDANISSGYVVFDMAGNVTLHSDNDLLLGGDDIEGVGFATSKGLLKLSSTKSIKNNKGLVKGDVIELLAVENVGDSVNPFMFEAKSITSNSKDLYLKTALDLQVGAAGVVASNDMNLDIGGSLKGVSGLEAGNSIFLKIGASLGEEGNLFKIKHGALGKFEAFVTGALYVQGLGDLRLGNISASFIDIRANNIFKSSGNVKISSTGAIDLTSLGKIGQMGVDGALEVDTIYEITATAKDGIALHSVNDLKIAKAYSSDIGAFSFITGDANISFANDIDFGNGHTTLYANGNISSKGVVSGNYLQITASNIGSALEPVKVSSTHKVDIQAFNDAYVSSANILILGKVSAANILNIESNGLVLSNDVVGGEVIFKSPGMAGNGYSVISRLGKLNMRGLDFISDSQITMDGNGDISVLGKTLQISQNGQVAFMESNVDGTIRWSFARGLEGGDVLKIGKDHDVIVGSTNAISWENNQVLTAGDIDISALNASKDVSLVIGGVFGKIAAHHMTNFNLTLDTLQGITISDLDISGKLSLVNVGDVEVLSLNPFKVESDRGFKLITSSSTVSVASPGNVSVESKTAGAFTLENNVEGVLHASTSGAMTIVGSKLNVTTESLKASALSIATPMGQDMELVPSAGKGVGKFNVADIMDAWNSAGDFALISGNDLIVSDAVVVARKLRMAAQKDIKGNGTVDAQSLDLEGFVISVKSTKDMNLAKIAFGTSANLSSGQKLIVDPSISLVGDITLSADDNLSFETYTFEGGSTREASGRVVAHGNSLTLSLAKMNSSDSSVYPFWTKDGGLQGGDDFVYATWPHIQGTSLTWKNDILKSSGNSLKMISNTGFDGQMFGTKTQWAVDKGLTSGDYLMVEGAKIMGSGLAWDDIASVTGDMSIDSGNYDIGTKDMSLGVHVPGVIKLKSAGMVYLTSGRAMDAVTDQDLNIGRFRVMETAEKARIRAINGASISVFGLVAGNNIELSAQNGIFLGEDSLLHTRSYMGEDVSVDGVISLTANRFTQEGGQIDARVLKLITLTGQDMKIYGDLAESEEEYAFENGMIHLQSFMDAWNRNKEESFTKEVPMSLELLSGSGFMVQTELNLGVDTRMLSAKKMLVDGNVNASGSLYMEAGEGIFRGSSYTGSGSKIEGVKISANVLSLVSGAKIGEDGIFSDSGLSKALRVSANELHVSAQQDTHIHSSDHVRLGKVMVSGGKFNLETLKSANITVTDDISALGILLETSGSLIVGGALDDGGKGLELRFGKRFSVSQDFKASTLLIGLAKSASNKGLSLFDQTAPSLDGNITLGQILAHWSNAANSKLTLESQRNLAVKDDLDFGERDVDFLVNEDVKFEGNVDAKNMRIVSSQGSVYQSSGKLIKSSGNIDFIFENADGNGAQDLGSKEFLIFVETPNGSVSVKGARDIYLDPADLFLRDVQGSRDVMLVGGKIEQVKGTQVNAGRSLNLVSTSTIGTALSPLLVSVGGKTEIQSPGAVYLQSNNGIDIHSSGDLHLQGLSSMGAVKVATDGALYVDGNIQADSGNGLLDLTGSEILFAPSISVGAKDVVLMVKSNVLAGSLLGSLMGAWSNKTPASTLDLRSSGDMDMDKDVSVPLILTLHSGGDMNGVGVLSSTNPLSLESEQDIDMKVATPLVNVKGQNVTLSSASSVTIGQNNVKGDLSVTTTGVTSDIAFEQNVMAQNITFVSSHDIVGSSTKQLNAVQVLSLIAANDIGKTTTVKVSAQETIVNAGNGGASRVISTDPIGYLKLEDYNLFVKGEGVGFNNGILSYSNDQTLTLRAIISNEDIGSLTSPVQLVHAGAATNPSLVEILNLTGALYVTSDNSLKIDMAGRDLLIGKMDASGKSLEISAKNLTGVAGNEPHLIGGSVKLNAAEDLSVVVDAKSTQASAGNHMDLGSTSDLTYTSLSAKTANISSDGALKGKDVSSRLEVEGDLTLSSSGDMDVATDGKLFLVKAVSKTGSIKLQSRDKIQVANDESLIKAAGNIHMAADLIGDSAKPLSVESKGKVTANAFGGVWIVSNEDLTLENANSDSIVSVISKKKLSLDNAVISSDFVEVGGAQMTANNADVTAVGLRVRGQIMEIGGANKSLSVDDFKTLSGKVTRVMLSADQLLIQEALDFDKETRILVSKLYVNKAIRSAHDFIAQAQGSESVIEIRANIDSDKDVVLQSDESIIAPQGQGIVSGDRVALIAGKNVGDKTNLVGVAPVSYLIGLAGKEGFYAASNDNMQVGGNAFYTTDAQGMIHMSDAGYDTGVIALNAGEIVLKTTSGDLSAGGVNTKGSITLDAADDLLVSGLIGGRSLAHVDGYGSFLDKDGAVVAKWNGSIFELTSGKTAADIAYYDASVSHVSLKAGKSIYSVGGKQLVRAWGGVDVEAGESVGGFGTELNVRTGNTGVINVKARDTVHLGSGAIVDSEKTKIGDPADNVSDMDDYYPSALNLGDVEGATVHVLTQGYGISNGNIKSAEIHLISQGDIGAPSNPVHVTGKVNVSAAGFKTYIASDADLDVEFVQSSEQGGELSSDGKNIHISSRDSIGVGAAPFVVDAKGGTLSADTAGEIHVITPSALVLGPIVATVTQVLAYGSGSLTEGANKVDAPAYYDGTSITQTIPASAPIPEVVPASVLSLFNNTVIASGQNLKYEGGVLKYTGNLKLDSGSNTIGSISNILKIASDAPSLSDIVTVESANAVFIDSVDALRVNSVLDLIIGDLKAPSVLIDAATKRVSGGTIHGQSVEVNAKEIDVSIDATGAVKAHAFGGDVRIHSLGDLAAGDIKSDTGNVIATSDGKIAMSGATSKMEAAKTVAVISAKDIKVNVSAANFVAKANGDITVEASGDMAIGSATSVEGLTKVTSTTGNVEIISNEKLFAGVDGAVDANVLKISKPSGDLEIADLGNIAGNVSSVAFKSDMIKTTSGSFGTEAAPFMHDVVLTGDIDVALNLGTGYKVSLESAPSSAKVSSDSDLNVRASNIANMSLKTAKNLELQGLVSASGKTLLDVGGNVKSVPVSIISLSGGVPTTINVNPLLNLNGGELELKVEGDVSLPIIQNAVKVGGSASKLTMMIVGNAIIGATPITVKNLNMTVTGDLTFEPGTGDAIIADSSILNSNHFITNGRKIKGGITFYNYQNTMQLGNKGIDSFIQIAPGVGMSDLNVLLSTNGANLALNANWQDLMVNSPISYTNGNLGLYGKKVILPATFGQTMVTTNQLTVGAREAFQDNGSKVDVKSFWIYDMDSQTLVDATANSLFNASTFKDVFVAPQTTDVRVGRNSSDTVTNTPLSGDFKSLVIAGQNTQVNAPVDASNGAVSIQAGNGMVTAAVGTMVTAAVGTVTVNAPVSSNQSVSVVADRAVMSDFASIYSKSLILKNRTGSFGVGANTTDFINAKPFMDVVARSGSKLQFVTIEGATGVNIRDGLDTTRAKVDLEFTLNGASVVGAGNLEKADVIMSASQKLRFAKPGGNASLNTSVRYVYFDAASMGNVALNNVIGNATLSVYGKEPAGTDFASLNITSTGDVNFSSSALRSASSKMTPGVGFSLIDAITGKPFQSLDASFIGGSAGKSKEQ